MQVLMQIWTRLASYSCFTNSNKQDNCPSAQLMVAPLSSANKSHFQKGIWQDWKRKRGGGTVRSRISISTWSKTGSGSGPKSSWSNLWLKGREHTSKSLWLQEYLKFVTGKRELWVKMLTLSVLEVGLDTNRCLLRGCVEIKYLALVWQGDCWHCEWLGK